MADADWARYKPLRGAPPPERVTAANSTYERERVLKFDFYAAVAVYRRLSGDGPIELLVKTYHVDRLGLLPLGWLGRWLANRESHYLAQLKGIEGTAPLLERYGPAGFVREFVSGVDLRQFGRTARPDERFFPRLAATLAAVHARGISHNDLSKPENVLVTPEGAPVLIDFQIALEATWSNWPIVGGIGRAIMAYFQKVDRYHLGKLHRRNRPMDFNAEQVASLKKKGTLLTLHGVFLRRPYRAVRHAVLNRFLVRRDAPAPVRARAPRSAGAPERSGARRP